MVGAPYGRQYPSLDFGAGSRPAPIISLNDRVARLERLRAGTRGPQQFMYPFARSPAVRYRTPDRADIARQGRVHSGHRIAAGDDCQPGRPGSWSRERICPTETVQGTRRFFEALVFRAVLHISGFRLDGSLVAPVSGRGLLT